MTKLPIDSILAALKDELQFRTSAVLVAPPGAGKTTRIPLALLDEPWLARRRILLLEPRRLAARAAARYMAASLGEQVGETVGYRVKLDTRVGPKTRIEVITEGVLTRLLQADPMLEDVGLVIFDEFHERSLQADLGLALCLQSQAILREDLRILVMSATLDAKPVAALLNDAPILTSEGRAFPIETHYLDRRFEGRMEPIVVRTLLDALENNEGDVLVFLPGSGEIRHLEAHLTELCLGQHITVTPLYGNLPQEAQDRAITPCPPGLRKIVLATSIAETSLTVEGVRIVIDGGQSRVPRFSPRTGMTHLETMTVSRSSADQRRGRAGRRGPGVCYRLWTEQDNRLLVPSDLPEIVEADLVPLALELAAWGVSAPEELMWLDLPPAAAFQQARELLSQLGALNESMTITPHGRQMAELGLHPRLAHMLLKAIPLGYGSLACELAAVLSERNIFRDNDHTPNADLRFRIEAIRRATGPESTTAPESKLNQAAYRQIMAEVKHWQKTLHILPSKEDNVDACGLLLAFAYPDRIAQRKATGRFLLRNGHGAVFSKIQSLSNTPYLVAAELDDKGAESRIYLAAPVSLDDLEHHFGNQIEEETPIAWDRSIQTVRARKRQRLGALLLKDDPLSNPAPEGTLAALLQGIAAEGLDILPWTRAARQLQERLNFMHLLEPEWPDMSNHTLVTTLNDWLAPHLYRLKSRSDLQRLQLVGIMETTLSWGQRQELEEFAPTHTMVPSGSRIPIDYSDPASPVLAVRLQELFGLKETPRIARNRVPLTLHLLSPAQRPVQVTRDLASFWQHAYYEVKKDLKGRYPKHYWPDDPLIAMPTNRTRPRITAK